MRFNFALVSSFLLASAVLADPRRSQLLDRLEYRTIADSGDSGYAGTALQKSDGTLHSVTARFSAPDPKGPSGSSASTAIWLDFGCASNIVIQAGVAFTVDSSGTSYEPWYAWPPIYSNTFNIPISARDDIRLTVKANSKTSGVVKIENLTNGRSQQVSFDSIHALCEASATWVVSEWKGPVASFGTIAFTDATAAGAAGHIYKPDPSLAFEMTQNDKNLTSTSVSGTTITIKRL